MTYAVIDPASVGRAARDMTRLSKEIIELTIEAANGLAAPGDSVRIEQAALQFKDLADRSAVYVKAVLKQAEEKPRPPPKRKQRKKLRSSRKKKRNLPKRKRSNL